MVDYGSLGAIRVAKSPIKMGAPANTNIAFASSLNMQPFKEFLFVRFFALLHELIDLCEKRR